MQLDVGVEERHSADIVVRKAWFHIGGPKMDSVVMSLACGTEKHTRFELQHQNAHQLGRGCESGLQGQMAFLVSCTIDVKEFIGWCGRIRRIQRVSRNENHNEHWAFP